MIQELFQVPGLLDLYRSHDSLTRNFYGENHLPLNFKF